VIQWICSDSKKHQTLARRIWATTGICLALLPLWTVWLGEWWVGRIRHGEAPRRPDLSPHPSVGPELGELVSAPSRVA
jgi:hypothetical protein